MVKNILCSKEDENACFKVYYFLENNKSFFNSFNAEYKRFKYYQEHCDYVPPRLYDLGKISKYHKHDKNRTKKIGEQILHGAHIPIVDILTMFFSKTELFNEMLKHVIDLSQEVRSKSNFIQNEVGRKKYNIRILNELRFLIFGFSDGFESRGALSSHAGQQKLTGVYYSLPCLPPHLVSKTSNVFLSTVFHSKYLSEPEIEYDAAFKLFLNDALILSTEGIEILVNGKLKRVYFDVDLILGDNLGLNSTLGFVESFSATRFCRFCYADKELCRCLCIERPDLIRKKENYEHDISVNNSRLTGLKQNCIFHKWD